MKKGLIIGLAATAIAAAVASLVSVGVSAGPLRQGPATRAAGNDGMAQTLPAHEITASLRAAGLDPNGEPVLRGRYYVLRAVDPRGRQLRVLADAQFGGILSVLPARRASAYPPSYNGGPRIIHVPQPDDAQAEVDYRDNGAADDVGHANDVAEPEPPAPVRRVRPVKRHRSAAPPPPVKRHTVSSAPPPPPSPAHGDDKVLTPVYPTPNFGAKAASGEKFELPPQASETVPPSPRLE